MKNISAVSDNKDIVTVEYVDNVTAAADKSDSFTINNTVNYPLLALTAYGRSTQGYASHGGEPLGKNLLSINQSYEISEAAYVWQLNSIVINAGTYTFSFQSSIAVSYSSAVAIVYQLEGELAKVEKGLIAQKGLNTYTFTVDKPIVSIRFYANDLMIGATISEFQLEKGNTATEYEPYYSKPNPEYPVPIESIGDSGNLTLTTCGKNLFFYGDYTEIPINPNAGGTVTKVADEITIVTSDRSSSGAIIPVSVVSTMLKNFNGCKITMSCDIYSDSEITISMGFSDLPRVKLNSGTWGRYSVVDTVNLEKGIRFYNKSGIAATIKIRSIQLEVGSIATDYEPYKSTTTKITTALPLRGIPVSSGGNYTDANGQEWVCDTLEYNYTAAVKKQRVAVIDSYNGETVESDYISTTGGLDVGVSVIYPAETVTETPLTADEINQLRNLETFGGVTNIYNSGNANMSVEYMTSKAVSKAVMPIITVLRGNSNA